MICFNSGCNNDSDNTVHLMGTCKGNENACFGTQTCNTETGMCVPKTCDKDPNVCYKTEKCNAKGECQAKSCIDDPRICYGTQSCDQKTGECVYKTCDIDPSVCDENEICNTETKKCMAKSCLDDPNICTGGKKCNSNGTCIPTCLSDPSICKDNERCTLAGECKSIKPCTEDPSVCSSEYLCENGECYTINQTDYTPDKPAFCEEKATIQFIIDNYEYLFNLLDALKDSRNNNGSETDACDEYLALEAEFNKQGPLVCKQLLSCSVGATRSFMICTSNFIIESIKARTIKNYIKSINIDPDLITNLDTVDSIFTQKTYNMLNYKQFLDFNGAKHKSICHTCTYDPSICTQNETCTNHNCIRKGKDYPDYCDNYLVIKFFLDHYDLYHDLMSNNLDIQTNAYQKLISLYNLYLDDLCRQMGDGCLYIDNETMNQCIKRILNNITSSDNLKDYLHDLEDIFINIQNFKMIRYEENLCYIYNLLNDDCSLFNGLKVLQFRNALTNTSNTLPITCDTSPEICQEEESCTNGECTDKSGTPRYCNYQPMVWFMLDHFDLINDIAGTDSNAACNSYNQLLELYKTEGKHACSITAGCQTGNNDNFNKCIINMLLELSDDSMPYYLSYSAPGYDETKAQSLNAKYGDLTYNINHIERLTRVLNGKICTNNEQP